MHFRYVSYVASDEAMWIVQLYETRKGLGCGQSTPEHAATLHSGISGGVREKMDIAIRHRRDLTI